MRTYTETVTLYKFDELSKEAQTEAIDEHRDFLAEAFNAEHLLDDWKEKLQALGYDTVNISYSGFWSQGDGASFTAPRIDLKQWLKVHKLGNKYRTLLNVADNVEASIDRESSRYVHENTIRCNIFGATESDTEEQQASEVEHLITTEARTLSQDIYKYLREAYEYDTSDEAVKESIQANEYEFTEEGILA